MAIKEKHFSFDSRAFFVSDIHDLKKIEGNHDRIYWGSETCDQHIPDINSTLTVLDYCKQKRLSLTVLTPPCSQKGSNRIKNLLMSLKDYGWLDEVVVNDLGLMDLVLSMGMKPVCGRLLAQVFRDPRPFTRKGKYFNYRMLGFNRQTIKFMHNHFGVRRYEVQPGIDSILDFSGIEFDKVQFSVYTPLSMVTRSRLCIINNFHRHQVVPQVTQIHPETCSQPCNDLILKIYDKFSETEFVLIENAVYFLNPLSINNILGINQVRLVDNSFMLLPRAKGN